MFYRLLLLHFAIAGANPIYFGTPMTFEHAYPKLNLHHLSQGASLLGQPLTMFHQYGNFDQMGTLSKGLLASHFDGQKTKGLPVLALHPTILALASPQIHHAAPMPYPIKKEMELPEKTIAGALVKQIPKVSKLPLAVSYSPKSLEFSSLEQSGILEGGLSALTMVTASEVAETSLLVLFAFLAVVNAGYFASPAYSHASYTYGAPHTVTAPALVSQHSNILRSYGNLGQISTYSKSISTPLSSVYKSDIRVNNDALVYPHAHGYAAAPAYRHAYAAPAYSHTYAAPNYVVPVQGHGYAAHAPSGLLGIAYSPATSAAHFSYSNGYGLHYSY